MRISRSRLAARWAVALLAATIWHGAVPAGLSAAGPLVEHHEVYSAFTLNLIRFITWPEDAFPTKDAPFVIGTFPRDPINEPLEGAARGESIEGREVRIMRIQSLDDLAQCHVVFLSKTSARHAAVLSRLSGKPVLTISDADGFLELGGHVRFVPQPPHTRLRISAENLKASRLGPRAQLLRIAAGS